MNLICCLYCGGAIMSKDILLDNSKKNKNVVTKEMLIKLIAKESGKDVNVVKSIYNIFEKVLTKLFAGVDENTDVSVRLFEGVSFDSSFIPQRKRHNNLTGKIIMATSKIKVKANITRNYCEKLAFSY